jgi:multiple sugar transport system permease protein
MMVGVVGRRNQRARAIGFCVLVAVTLAPILFVFAYMISTSLKRSGDITAPDFTFLFTPTLANYREVFVENEFMLFVKNSLIVGAGSTAIGLAIGIPAAYAIARYQVPRLATVILAGRVAPGITFLIPWFIIFSRLGWTDTYAVLILAHLLQNLPLMVFLLISFLEDVPSELIESAKVDGAGTLRTIWSIVLPVARGGIAATAILGFIFSWNHFMFSIVLSGNDTRTLPVAVFNFMSYGSVNWGAITAAAVTMALPAVVITLFVQRHIVHGLAAGAVKG